MEKKEQKEMSQWDKLLSKILNLSNDLKFNELKKVLEKYGYVMSSPNGGSSHATFRRKGYLPITVPRHDPIKKIYVKKVKKIIEQEFTDGQN